MKVAIYIRQPTTVTGGVERFAASLADALRRRRHECQVFCDSDLGCPPGASFSEFQTRLAEHWKSRRQAYDIGLFNCEWGSRVPGGRTVNVFHGTSRGQVLATLGLRRLRSSLASFVLGGHLQWLAGRKHHRVAVSRSARRDLAWLYGLPGTLVIQNAVDEEQYSPGNKQAAREKLGLAAEARVYLYATRIEPLKCPWFLPEWAGHLRGGEHLVVAADKPPEGLAGNVTVLRNVPREEMPALYQAADASLMPSYYEGCSYAVIEAMSCGCLLVASPVGHAPDIIRSDPLLAECFERRRNALAFLNRARRILDDPPLAQTLREHERQYVLEHNTLDKMGSQYEALFARILAERGH